MCVFNRKLAISRKGERYGQGYTSARLDLQTRELLQQRSLRRLWNPLTSTPVGIKLSGATYCRQPEVRPHCQHHSC